MSARNLLHLRYFWPVAIIIAVILLWIFYEPTVKKANLPLSEEEIRNLANCIFGSEHKVNLFGVELTELPANYDMNPLRTEALDSDFPVLVKHNDVVVNFNTGHPDSPWGSVTLTPIINRCGMKSLDIDYEYPYPVAQTLYRNTFQCDRECLSLFILDESCKSARSGVPNWRFMVAVAGHKGYGVVCWNTSESSEKITGTPIRGFRRFQIDAPWWMWIKDGAEGWEWLRPVLPAK